MYAPTESTKSSLSRLYQPKLNSPETLENQGFHNYGGIAQLGERLNGIQEVSGSIPLISTKLRKTVETSRFGGLFC